jgi:hypothetical protein
MRLTSTMRPCFGLRSVVAGGMVFATLATSARADLTLKLGDYATAPMTGIVNGTNNNAYLARVNFMAEEPGGGRNRFFVNDLNGPMYILDKTTKTFTSYLEFNGRNGLPGMYSEFVFSSGFANGLITFQFDPDYVNNGKFYTVHMEDPNTDLDRALTHPPAHTVSYTTTSNIFPGAGSSDSFNNRQTVLVEWTDTNIGNSTFEGTAREMLRMSMTGQIHPMGDIIFNPNAGPADADWRVMYISVGDGGQGESGTTGTRRTPQRLDSLGGKVLRIRADNTGANTPVTVSPNGAYYIPNNNPFTGITNSAVRDEVFALGLRNPHRISWDAPTDKIIVNDIGLNTWEEVNFITSGSNYGYSEIEGNEVLETNNQTSSDPLPATIPRRITSTTTSGTMVPVYPVAQYGHGNAGQPTPEGDSITSGYMYRGTNIPSLQGKYIWGDITTGQLFWSEYAEMLAADDGDPATLAEIHQVDVAWDNPFNGPGFEVFETRNEGSNTLGPMFDIVERTYEGRGGLDDRLPGNADVTGGNVGRADIRWQIDDAGELFLLSKSDGMIRYIIEAIGTANFNSDAYVDGADFLIWQQHLGMTGATRADGDADGDGLVTAADLTFWQKQFGLGGEGAAGVPEPASWALAAAGLLGLARRRRRAA